MKNILTIIILFLGVNSSWANVPKYFLGDTVKVGFEKDTIRIFEGDSTRVFMRLEGKIPKESTIEIKYTIKSTDATDGKDFVFRGNTNFTFRAAESTIQGNFFDLLTKQDNNEERESIILELAIVKGAEISKITKGTCVIILRDYKTPTELAQEVYREENAKVLTNVQRIINEDKDTSEVIGTVKVKNFTVKRGYLIEYKKEKKGGKERSWYPKWYESDSIKFGVKPKYDSIKINKVDVLFKYGVAAEIKAYATSGEIYSNLWYNGYNKRLTRMGVSFRHQAYNSKYRGFLLTGKSNPKSVIRMFDLIEYDDSTGLNFLPNDTTIRLTKKDTLAKLSIKTSLNSYVHLNFYSDALSLFRADRGNALLQTEASAKIFLRTIPTKRKMNFMLNYISPYLKYSRFDNGFNSVFAELKTDKIADKIDTTYSINRMLVNQRKYLDIGLKLNVFNLVRRFYNTIEGNVFVNFGWFDRRGDIDKVQTQLTGTTQYQGIASNTVDFGIEGRYSIFQYRNFGLNLAGMAFAQKIWNNKLSTYNNGGYELFYRTEAELFYFPVTNSKDKIFLRSYHVMNNNTKEPNFTQLQFGYKAMFKVPNTKKQ